MTTMRKEHKTPDRKKKFQKVVRNKDVMSDKTMVEPDKVIQPGVDGEDKLNRLKDELCHSIWNCLTDSQTGVIKMEAPDHHEDFPQETPIFFGNQQEHPVAKSSIGVLAERLNMLKQQSRYVGKIAGDLVDGLEELAENTSSFLWEAGEAGHEERVWERLKEQVREIKRISGEMEEDLERSAVVRGIHIHAEEMESFSGEHRSIRLSTQKMRRFTKPRNININSRKLERFIGEPINIHTNAASGQNWLERSAEADHLKSRNGKHKGKKKHYNCDVCGLGLIGYDQMRKHKRRHTEKPYKCDICNLKYAYVASLERHRLVHSKWRQYRREHSDVKFANLSRAKRHKVNDTNIYLKTGEMVELNDKLPEQSRDIHINTENAEVGKSKVNYRDILRSRREIAEPMEKFREQLRDINMNAVEIEELNERFSVDSRNIHINTGEIVEQFTDKQRNNLTNKRKIENEGFTDSSKNLHLKTGEIVQVMESFTEEPRDIYNKTGEIEVMESFTEEPRDIYNKRGEIVEVMESFTEEPRDIYNKTGEIVEVMETFAEVDSNIHNKRGEIRFIGKPRNLHINTGEMETFTEEPKEICIKEECLEMPLEVGTLNTQKRGRNKQYKCQVCSLEVTGSARIRRHRLSHRVASHQCDVCGLRFPWFRSLKRHKVVHNEDMPYQCEYCGLKYAFLSCLEKHQRVHTGERPFKCEVCHRAFTQSNSRDKHHRTHT